MKRILHIIFLTVTMLSLASCNDDGVNGPVDMTCTDLVTFMGNEDGRATFVFRKIDDSPEITLTAQGGIDETEIGAGSRLLIRYIPENNQAYTSGDITLLGGSLISTSMCDTEWRNEYDLWDKDKVYVYSIWRSGKYINVHVRLTYTTEPRVFRLVADPSTIDGAWPELYLVHILPGITDNHDRAYYASFDIENLWSRAQTQGVKIHVANRNLDKQIFTFAKSNNN